MSGNGKKNNNKIIERLKEKYEVVDFVETQYKSHIIDILNEKYKEYDTVVVTGGDGTLNETVNALAEKENAPKIGYIPSGTCNDVARSLNIPKNVDKALDIILKYKSPDTVVGIGKDVARPKEIDKVTTIKDLDETEINMTSIVIVGNKNTYVKDGRMITPRGYTL